MTIRFRYGWAWTFLSTLSTIWVEICCHFVGYAVSMMTSLYLQRKSYNDLYQLFKLCARMEYCQSIFANLQEELARNDHQIQELIWFEVSVTTEGNMLVSPLPFRLARSVHKLVG